MPGLLALVTLHAALITVRGADARCPSAKQVNEAVAARLPGVLVPAEPAPSAEVLQLSIAAGGPEAERRFELSDPRGKVLLSRTLPAVANARERDCEALAETVALIVDRYLQELAYQSPPPTVTTPPPPPAAPPRERRWELFAGGTWQPTADGPALLGGPEGRVGVGRNLDAAARFAAEVTLGVQGSPERTWMEKTGRLWAIPAELRLLWRRSVRTFRLEVGPFVGAQLLLLGSIPEEKPGSVHVGAVSGAVAMLRYPLGNRAFLRLVVAGGVAVRRYQFTPHAPGAGELFGTEPAYAKMGAEGGIAFW